MMKSCRVRLGIVIESGFNIVCHQHIAMANVQPSVSNCRMGTLLVICHRDGEPAHRLEGLGIRFDQVHRSVFCENIQHTIRENHHASFDSICTPHDFAGSQLQAVQSIAAGLSCSVDVAVDANKSVHLAVQHLVLPFRCHAQTVVCQC